MKIYLIGLPGSGKSTLGKELALMLNISFVDLDLEIEKEAGRKINVIFKEDGEDYFRNLESGHLKRWIDSSVDFVMATGGGTPCFFDHMNWINASGKSIFLDVPASEIGRRIDTLQRSERPLFADAGPEEVISKVESMRAYRLPFYQRAHLTFSGKAIRAKQIKESISGSGS